MGLMALCMQGCGLKPGEVVVVSSGVSVSVPIAKDEVMLSDIGTKSRFSVTPGLVHVDHGSTTIAVDLCNTCKFAIKVKPGDAIAQLEQVSIVSDDIDVQTKTDIANDLLQKLHLGFQSSVVSPEEVDGLKDMLMKWQYVLQMILLT